MQDIRMERDPLLVEREKTHGSFEINAQLYHEFKKIGNDLPERMNVPQRLALDMIYLKLARALSNPHTKDTWNDIAGYAKLGAEACE